MGVSMEEVFGYIEKYPPPQECIECKEQDCHECDTAGKRWRQTRKAELQGLRNLKLNAIARLERQIAEIERELRGIADDRS